MDDRRMMSEDAERRSKSVDAVGSGPSVLVPKADRLPKKV
jgi:hypothetical protein